jgi:hypothetical protein
MQKTAIQIIIEAIFVGILLIPMYLVIASLLKDTTDNLYVILFLSGFFFHIICEITGVNLWYVKQYNSILKD